MLKLYQMLNKMKFKQINTGGGCQAYEYKLPCNDRYAILITDGEAGITDLININPTIIIEDTDTGETITIKGKIVDHPETDDTAG
jgi:hypothetical protein|tara:strand:- start:81 stop:335 length:255 start_codon:yes stop_codon:yes gene_type:complete